MNNFFQNNHRRVRSAKNDSKDSSYLNGSYIHQRHLETEESFYNRQKSLKKSSNKKSIQYFANKQRISTEKLYKQPQEIFQENLVLKNQLHSLNKKFQIQKGKIEIHKRKTNEITKKLNRQFQKQLYWESTKNPEYLVTGIKYEYEKIKKMYQQKCSQIQIMSKKLMNTDIQQLSQYCKTLQIQNKILIQNITYLKMQKQKQIMLSKQMNKQFILQCQINQYLNKNQKLNKRNQKLQLILEQKISNQNQLTKKIAFLQKTLIQKDNSAHQSNKKAKKIERQNKKIYTQMKQLEANIKYIQKKYQIDIKQANNLQDRQVKLQKQTFQKYLKQKDLNIQKLQKQIGYLSTLLSFWKPLDQLNSKDSNSKNQLSQLKKSANAHVKSNNNLSQPSIDKISYSKTPNKQNEKYADSTKILNEQDYLSKQDLQFLSANIDEQLNKSRAKNVNQIKLPHRSTKKWTQSARKCRKIQLNQIQHLGELIKYKLIGNSLQIVKIKDLLSIKVQTSNINEQFIRMKQIKGIFMCQPFNLIQDDAFKLSRYLCEQQGLEFVYCHEQNQIERSIVKSIIKNLIGSYELLNNELSQQKWKQIKKSYCHNMQLALKSIYPKGIISKNKLFQLFKSLGIQIDDDIKDYLIGKLIIRANSLNQLNYQILFTSQEQLT